MSHCQACDAAGDYDCPECGAAVCVDHRLPDAHECTAADAADNTGESDSQLPLGFRWYHHVLAVGLTFANWFSAGGGIAGLVGALVGTYAVVYLLVHGYRHLYDRADDREESKAA
jgi:hypothetical protein